MLRGRGGGVSGRRAGSGTLGELWRPGPIGPEEEQAALALPEEQREGERLAVAPEGVIAAQESDRLR